jgi:hypothetical protein
MTTNRRAKVDTSAQSYPMRNGMVLAVEALEARLESGLGEPAEEQKRSKRAAGAANAPTQDGRDASSGVFELLELG